MWWKQQVDKINSFSEKNVYETQRALKTRMVLQMLQYIPVLMKHPMLMQLGICITYLLRNLEILDIMVSKRKT